MLDLFRDSLFGVLVNTTADAECFLLNSFDSGLGCSAEVGGSTLIFPQECIQHSHEFVWGFSLSRLCGSQAELFNPFCSWSL
jgi:hypothetical protein